jgi:iron-sulfur cluster assembly protein
MLTLTENASTIVKTIVDQSAPGDDSGLRFSQEGANQGALTVAPTESAQPGDAVVEQDGARVYLDEDAAVALGDQVLDASVDQNGAVQFSIAPSGGAAAAGAPADGVPTA